MFIIQNRYSFSNTIQNDFLAKSPLASEFVEVPRLSDLKQQLRNNAPLQNCFGLLPPIDVDLTKFDKFGIEHYMLENPDQAPITE